MKKIKFQIGDRKLQVIKAIYELLIPNLKDAKRIAESGEVECPDDKYDVLCKAITEAGGTIEEKHENDVAVPEPKHLLMSLIRDITDEVVDNEDDRINDTFVVVNCANEVCIESRISISERLYQQLQISGKDEAKVVQQHIRLVAAFKALPAENEKGHPTSVLVLRVPENHNSTSDIEVLSEAATTIHETILKAVSKTSVFDNIEKDLKPFYDE